MLERINQLMDLSKVETGRMQVVAERFHVKEQIVHVLVYVQTGALERGLEIGLACGSDEITPFEHIASSEVLDHIGEAFTDRARVVQAVYNLLSNASKFTEQGQVVVRVSKDATSGGEECLVISVSDTGIGIPTVDLDTIFEAFSEANGSPPRGIGLSLTKKIAELLGGSINVESEIGKGSTFTLRVPVVYQED